MGVLTENDRLTRPAAADFVRVVAVFSVGWFHIWQQSWVGAGALEFWPRSGAVWVDVMILLSAFCLFLPVANAMAQGRTPAAIRPRAFWRKRAVRILPGYYAVLAAALVWQLAFHGWYEDLPLDLAAHLTLTQTWFRKSYLFTRLNGVTWTLGVLAGLYLVFPWLARLLASHPLPALAALLAVQGAATAWLLPQYGTIQYQMGFNQLPAFCGVLAAGFAAALALAVLGRRPALQTTLARTGFTVAGLAAFGVLAWLLKQQAGAGEYQLHQLVWRMPLALAAAAVLVCLSLGLPMPFPRLWRWLAGISYQFYLWHQMLAVWLKYDLRLPPWSGDVPPNQLGDTLWMHRYALLAWAAALAAAVAATYAVERPAAAQLSSKA